jgi:DNA replication protein DnaC
MPELNSNQLSLLEEAIRRRKEAVEAANATKGAEKKKVVSPEEYARKLNAQIQLDSSIASTLKKERIDSALRDWDTLVGRRFARAKIDDPVIAEKVNVRVRRIVDGGPLHRNSIVLIGHLGVGKTWTSYAYARQLIEEGALSPGEVLFGTEIGLLTPLALATYDRTEKIQSFLDPSRKFYLIDEVGRATFKSTELRHEIWYAIINHAYENHIPIVITTNKSSRRSVTRDTKTNKEYSNELEAWIGEAAYDRLKYMADDGVIIPGDVNKRAEVNVALDGQYNDGTARPVKDEPEPTKPAGRTSAAKKTPSTPPQANLKDHSHF